MVLMTCLDTCKLIVNITNMMRFPLLCERNGQMKSVMKPIRINLTEMTNINFWKIFHINFRKANFIHHFLYHIWLKRVKSIGKLWSEEKINWKKFLTVDVFFEANESSLFLFYIIYSNIRSVTKYPSRKHFQFILLQLHRFYTLEHCMDTCVSDGAWKRSYLYVQY